MKMKRKLNLLVALAAVPLFLLVTHDGWAQGWTAKAQEALVKAMAEMALSPGDPRLLALTNAGFGQIGSQSTEAFWDIAGKETGCSPGARSLLPVHTSVQEPLWCALYRKDTGKMVFFKWTGDGFGQQVIDASPEKILSPEGWKAASAGLVGKNLFSVVSISLTWAINPPWTLLLASTFHDHLCPGLNAGYIFAEYLMDRLPLGPGEQYMTVTAPGKCPADALQVLFNTTGGKGGGYVMAIGNDLLANYSKGAVQPSIVAMKVNRKSDACEGMVLGFDWDKVMADTGIKREHLFSKEGPSDPWFWISRVKASAELAKMPRERLLGYAVELKRFSGKAGLADKVASGDPYAVVWNQ
jgi:formylmethanofuran dehydrogenase subunit E-like metal-binding protein